MTQAAVLQTTQWGLESIPGTPVAADKLLRAVSVEASFGDVNIEEFRPEGIKINTFTIYNRERMMANLSGKPTYTELVYMLASAVDNVAPTLAPGASVAQLWEYSPDPDGPDDPATYTIEKIAPDRSYRFAHALVNQLGYTVTRNPSSSSIDMTGQMVGQRLEDGIVPTPTPTEIDIIPMIPLQFDLYIDDVAANLGTTQITDAFTVTWSWGPRYMLFEAIDSSEPSFSGFYEIALPSTMEVRFERSAAASAYIDSMRANETLFLRLAASGPADAIEAGFTYEFTHDFAGQIVTPNLSNENELATIGFTFANVVDSDWGEAQHIALQNDLTTL